MDRRVQQTGKKRNFLNLKEKQANINVSSQWCRKPEKGCGYISALAVYYKTLGLVPNIDRWGKGPSLPIPPPHTCSTHKTSELRFHRVGYEVNIQNHCRDPSIWRKKYKVSFTKIRCWRGEKPTRKTTKVAMEATESRECYLGTDLNASPTRMSYRFSTQLSKPKNRLSKNRKLIWVL